ncbi:hypothetical protein FVE85_4657 [Porphyridium purpureum]|uniref:Gut esterase 1 n=1 Tax=Porphyridium purpureum TaxID=35688 RepID=A0A5J4YRG8_PORPP|nr:hypothetical protein FVE85_4657 [Porphyridium purpureum]|eukprot:POR9892..scf236_6
MKGTMRMAYVSCAPCGVRQSTWGSGVHARRFRHNDSRQGVAQWRCEWWKQQVLACVPGTGGVHTSIVPRRQSLSSRFMRMTTTAASEADPSDSAAGTQAQASSEQTEQGDASRRLNATVREIFDAIDSINLRGNWVFDSGNYILLPPSGTRPKAVIHFVGGAFVGRIPHLTYQYFLESLAAEGFLIVATAYDIGLNHMLITDDILTKFDAVATGLALDYGALPVVSVGHSAGALFHALGLSLFPSCQRSAVVLISFNNNQLSDAIPLFKEALGPLISQAYASQDAIPQLRQSIQSLLRVPAQAEQFAQRVVESDVLPTFFKSQFLPTLRDARRIFEQIEPIFDDLAGGNQDFYPSPSDVELAIRARFSAEHVLAVKYGSDPIDATDKLVSFLSDPTDSAASSITGSTRQVLLRVLKGGHASPALQDPFLKNRIPFLENALPEALLGVREPARQCVLSEVEETVRIIAEWIDERLESNDI